MKSVLFLSALLGCVSAIAVPQKVSYDNHKVVRVEDNPEVQQFIKQYSLATWVKQNGKIDVVVPPGVTALDGMDMVVMHENLGDSIAKEANYDAYQGD